MEDDGAKKHDPLALPAPEVLRDIERKQAERRKEILERRRKQDSQLDDEAKAARVIQRSYRGHRDRRAMQGYGLDPSTRWLEALKEGEHKLDKDPTLWQHAKKIAEYNLTTRPKPRDERFSESQTTTQRVRSRWAHVGAVARRAGCDDTSESEADAGSQAEAQKVKRQQKAEREKYAKTMGLEYFLEMVDQKHRYGSNLRRYHQEWKKSTTTENFFYWLDYGEGKELDLEDRPRERLDKEQVRYLSRDERKKYMVTIDTQGRFCWDKNGKPITTSPDFKDSIDGIVHASDDTPTWREVTTGEKPEPSRHDSGSDSSSTNTSISTGSQEDSSKYANEEFHDARGLNKLNHVSVDALMNHLLRKTTKKNTWIFVADTSFRLYVGIKQSGAFQHSSFLKGARVSAAGLIEIKRGQIRKLSPLSGHYAPPVKNFREFLKCVKEAGADLSRLNVSRSYAVILGLEGYIKVKKRTKSAKQHAKDMIHPDEKRKREEEERDKSQSAAREREVLKREAEKQRERSYSYRFRKKVSGRMGSIGGDGNGKGEMGPGPSSLEQGGRMATTTDERAVRSKEDELASGPVAPPTPPSIEPPLK